MLQRIGRKLRREWEHQERRHRLPEQTVLLLTNPRSGSTWLFDALRCHPGLIVNAEADLWQYLGMRGRRYPKDLRGDPDNAVRIEVRPGEWEALPRYVFADLKTILAGESQLGFRNEAPPPKVDLTKSGPQGTAPSAGGGSDPAGSATAGSSAGSCRPGTA